MAMVVLGDFTSPRGSALSPTLATGVISGSCLYQMIFFSFGRIIVSKIGRLGWAAGRGPKATRASNVPWKAAENRKEAGLPLAVDLGGTKKRLRVISGR